MASPPTPADIVVGIRLRVVADLNKFRVEGTVQTTAGGIMLYNEEVAYFATYAEVIAWLGALISAEDAATPLAIS